MQAVVLVGGKGTRLSERLNGKPKPLVEIGGKPLLQRQIESLVDVSVDEVLLLTSYKHDLIEEFIDSHDSFGIDVTLVNDGEPKGTGGALLSAIKYLNDQFLVIYGDTLFNVDLNRLMRYHESSDCAATLLVHPNDHPGDSDLIDVDLDGIITGFHPYPHPPDSILPNLVNAGMYVMNRSGLDGLTAQLPPFNDLAKHVFPLMLSNGAILRSYNTPEYIKDTGTPDRLDRVEMHIKTGLFDSQRLDIKQKAVFIDRDGTLNIPAGHLNHHEQLELYPDVPNGMLQIQAAHYRTVLISNQPVVARGEVSLEEMKVINAKLDTLLAKSGSFLDAKYFCFHHPDSGFKGEIPDLKFVCECRKPKPGLIFRAQDDLNIDLSSSWFIGDSTLDFGAAANAGVRSIGVRTGLGSNDGLHPHAPDILVDNFGEAANFIMNIYPDIFSKMSEFFSKIGSARQISIQANDIFIAEGISAAIKQNFSNLKFKSHKNCNNNVAGATMTLECLENKSGNLHLSVQKKNSYEYQIELES